MASWSPSSTSASTATGAPLAATMSGLTSTLAMSGRAAASADNPSSTCASATASTAASPRNSPSSFWVLRPSIISLASMALSGTGRNTTSATASASTPPTPSMTLAPNCGSRTMPAMSSRLPLIMGATSSDTSPSAAVALPSNSAAAASTAASSARRSFTRPRSVLCAMASPHSFTTTGKPTTVAAAAASAAVTTSRSSAIGTPYSRSSAFESASDRVVPWLVITVHGSQRSPAAPCHSTANLRSAQGFQRHQFGDVLLVVVHVTHQVGCGRR